MKKIILLFLLLFNSIFSFSQNSEKGIWKSSYSELRLKFDENWQLITPQLDSERKTMIALTDSKDHSSITVKITDDVPKEQLSDEAYNDAVKEQMLKADAENKFLVQEVIDFKEKKFTVQIFLMKTKFGDFALTCYTYRDGRKVKSIQLAYPRSLVSNPGKELPEKIKKVLSDMNI
ncbi:hypothetical protein [Flavobacterium suzhouense]|uniref:DUF1795 domain-containing protein n=1 Tax=Flavobacterium suzhouense TaxID=1529638 RepID=A0ABW5NPY1_9FLAO